MWRMDDKKWLTPKQVAEKVGVHTETVRRWIRAGNLPVHMLSAEDRKGKRHEYGPHGRYLIDPEDVAHVA